MLSFAACSTTSYLPTSNEMNNALQEITGQDGRACVRVRDISGFGTINDTTLSVSGRFGGHYLMVTMHRCPNLDGIAGKRVVGVYDQRFIVHFYQSDGSLVDGKGF